MSDIVTEMQATATARSYISAMDCLICMDIMDGNIYLCDNGHSVCGTCKSGLQLCPQCRTHITYNRNYQLEHLICEINSLLDNMYECSFSDYGCTERMDIKGILEHEKQCQNRLIFCSFANEGCAEVMRSCELNDHENKCRYRSIQCTFSKNGCDKVGEKKDIEKHESKCLFRSTSCSFFRNGCKTSVYLSDRSLHESTCEFQRMKCIFTKEGCSKVGRVDDIQQHISSCKYRTVLCSFKQKGCGAVLRLPEMRKHELLCEFRSVYCIFSASGCSEKAMVSELEEHEKICEFHSRRINLTNFSDEPLRCENCSDILNSEVFSIVSETGAYCEQCSQEYEEDTVFRNNGFENLIDEIRKHFLLHCMYNYNGCDKFLDLNNKTAHEIECEYRDVDCQFSTCTWKGKIELLYTHSLTHSNVQDMIFKNGKYYSNNMSENIESKDLSIVMLKAGEELFSCTIQKEDCDIHWVVQLIGPTSVANKYTYKVKIFKEDEKLIGKKVCESDSLAIKNIINDEKCVCFSLNTYDTFLDDEILNFVIVIKEQSP